MNKLEVLRELRDNWSRNQFTTGMYARGGNGDWASSGGGTAEQWCTVGRIRYIRGDTHSLDIANELLITARQLNLFVEEDMIGGRGEPSITRLSDRVGYDVMQDVIAVTIERLEEKEQTKTAVRRERELVTA